MEELLDGDVASPESLAEARKILKAKEPTRTATPRTDAEITYVYTKGGRGVGIARYEEVDYSRDGGGGLAYATAEPLAQLDGGHYAEDWHALDAASLGFALDEGWLSADVVHDIRLVLVRAQGTVVLRELAARDSAVVRVGKLAKAWLGVRRLDNAGHGVYVHDTSRTRYERGDPYLGTVVYETREWTHAFAEWINERADLDGLEEVEPLSSYEIGVLAS